MATCATDGHRGGKGGRVKLVVIILVLSLPVLISLPAARAPEVQTAHLWLNIVPGTYVAEHQDPWLRDSVVDPVDYQPNGVYFANLTIANRGFETTNASLLIAIPDNTTSQWFARVEMNGGAGGFKTYTLSNFARTDYNPYDDPIILPDNPQKGIEASHGVYPPSGNAIWATHWVGNLAGRDQPGDSAVVSIKLVLGPNPSASFRIHWDAYGLHPTTGELQYFVPPSHDATVADDSLLAVPPPIQVVDVSGNGNRIAIGWGSKVSLFDTFAPASSRLLWTVNAGLQVEAVSVCESGDYVGVAINEVPLSGTTKSYVHLYRSSDAVLLRNVTLDHNVFRAPRSMDISRDCKYLAAGTGNWELGTTSSCRDLSNVRKGSVFLVGNPDIVSLTSKQHTLIDDCAMGVRFSGNGAYLFVAKFWSADDKGINIYDVPGGSPWGPRAQAGFAGDVWYSVAVNLDGTRFSTGRGQTKTVIVWSFNPSNNTTTQLWLRHVGGTHHRQTLANDAAYLITLSQKDRADHTPGYHLHNTVTSDQQWSSTASVNYPTSVDLSVANSLWAVGANGTKLQLWGNGISVPPPGPMPSFQHTTSGATTDAAISYTGRIAVGSDDDGFLYVVDTALPGGPGVYWTWRTS